uniref:BTB domain-containing protein n=1 Tax=Panagrolaimus sp. ES5 TaxID=591445 RepID=A0AC34FYR3_9BILA
MSSSIPSIYEKPIAFRWKIAYDQFLNASEDQYWCLESETINVEHYGMENYFLRLSPSEEDENMIALELVIEKKICTYEELIDPKNNYFVNGNLVILMEAILTWKQILYDPYSENCKCDEAIALMSKNNYNVINYPCSWCCKTDGKLKIEKTTEVKKQPLARNLSLQLWNRDDKDFTFVAGGKEIRVHKFIIIDCHVFERMIESGLKESKENKVIITDFSFETVEIALQYFYGIEITDLLTVNNAFNLIRFADKYDITDLKVSYF